MLFHRPVRGMLAALITAATMAAPSFSQAQSPQAVTFDQLLQYVELQVPEAKLLQLIEGSPTQFVLGAEQLQRLSQAGATESILAALQAKSPAVSPGSDVTDFVLILDCSGSMNDKLSDGGSKWNAARHAALNFIESIPTGRNLALIVYGTDVARKCRSVDVLRSLAPLSDNDRSQLTQTIQQLKAVGHTPIANSLERAGAELSSAAGMASIVLITDGMESCHGDPALVAGNLVDQLPHLRGGINVVGFCLSQREAQQVARIAQAGHGEFYSAQTADQLLASIRSIKAATLPVAPVETVDYSGLSPLERLLIEQLSDPDIDVREQAARTVAERKISAAVPALKNLIAHVPYGNGIYGDSDRTAALDALLVVDPEQAGAALGGAMLSPTYKVRVWAGGAARDRAVAGAIPFVEQRLLAMQDDDISPTLINGTDEADALFGAVQQVAPGRLEELMVQLMRSRSAHVKAWATEKAKQLP
jgi:hypothetical protein